MNYRRCGNSGLMMPELSLGLWHNFAAVDGEAYQNAKNIVWQAFDNGITQFDLANNYGPPVGAAEATFGKILRDGFAARRDQMIITTKAGHAMWDGPYGDWGSRKHLVASCDQSLERLGLKYVDIFYHHRPDQETPLEETVGALEYIIKSGRALYIGLSKYPAERLRQATKMLREKGVDCIVDQQKYSLLHRDPETTHIPLHAELGLGFVSFSPLAQGQLSERCLKGIPSDSRASKNAFLTPEEVERNIETVREFKRQAEERGLSLSQYAIRWQLDDRRVTSVIMGVSSAEQLRQNLEALEK